MWGLIISTIIYALVVWKIGPILDEHGLKKSMQKNILLALIAFVLSIIPIMIIDYLEKPSTESDSAQSLNIDSIANQANPSSQNSNSGTKPKSTQEKELEDAMKSLNEYSKLSK